MFVISAGSRNPGRKHKVVSFSKASNQIQNTESHVLMLALPDAFNPYTFFLLKIGYFKFITVADDDLTIKDCKWGVSSKNNVFKLLVQHLSTLNQLHVICYAVAALIRWHENQDDAFYVCFREINYKRAQVFFLSCLLTQACRC